MFDSLMLICHIINADWFGSDIQNHLCLIRQLLHTLSDSIETLRVHHNNLAAYPLGPATADILAKPEVEDDSSLTKMAAD